jgi:succinate dehydrogenase flavin-adding protein (antitoxin of CptAB toxin-antitoxin module)
MNDSIVEKVIKKYQERSELGQKKYGTTLDRKDLTLLDWINHAQEEAMDLSLYLEKLKQKLTTEGINVD